MFLFVGIFIVMYVFDGNVVMVISIVIFFVFVGVFVSLFLFFWYFYKWKFGLDWMFLEDRGIVKIFILMFYKDIIFLVILFIIVGFVIFFY